MRPSTLLIALYPPAVRDRWGAELREAVAASGVRAWPDTVAGAIRLWLHPSDWPETTAGQTRRTLLVALAVVTAGTALILRSIEPSTTITADPRHPGASLWLVPLLLGTALALPVRPARWTAVPRLVGDAARIMTAPAIAFVALFLVANSGLLSEHPSGAVGTLLLAWYWGTLVFAALRACALAARVCRAVVAPSARRLRAAALLIGSGVALAAAQGLLVVVRGRLEGGSIAAFLAMALLATATIRAGLDLRPAASR
jgi:hypothetical protein